MSINFCTYTGEEQQVAYRGILPFAASYANYADYVAVVHIHEMIAEVWLCENAGCIQVLRDYYKMERQTDYAHQIIVISRVQETLFGDQSVVRPALCGEPLENLIDAIEELRITDYKQEASGDYDDGSDDFDEYYDNEDDGDYDDDEDWDDEWRDEED